MKIEPTTTQLGWIGTGVMGRWMCQHLMDLGYGMTVYNRTKAKADPLLEAGAAWADSPSDVAAVSDVIFTIVGFPPDVREVYLGDDGILKGTKPGSIIVDMTTTEPSLAQEIYAAAQTQDVSSVDAPVSGGDVGAKEARLSIMVGGDEDTVQAVMPLFEAMGKNKSVICCTLFPSVSITKISRFLPPCRSLAKAIRSPSGCQSGKASYPG